MKVASVNALLTMPLGSAGEFCVSIRHQVTILDPDFCGCWLALTWMDLGVQSLRCVHGYPSHNLHWIFKKIKVRALFLKFFLSRGHLGSLLCQEILGGISSSKWKAGLCGVAHHSEMSGSFVGDGGFHDTHTMASCSLLVILPLTCKLGCALIGVFEPLPMKGFELRCPKGSTMQRRSTNLRIWEVSG